MIVKGKWDTFLTLTGENLLLVQRKHRYVILLPILFTSFALAVFLFGAYFFFIYAYYSPQLFFITALILVSIALSLITKIIIDWYFHLYILTTRKIIEMWYTPLAAHTTSGVLLDKVSCTEIDLHVNGFVHELLDVGDVVITFDRPTHQEDFVLKDIKNSHRVGQFLAQQLLDHEVKNNLQPVWFRRQGGRVS